MAPNLPREFGHYRSNFGQNESLYAMMRMISSVNDYYQIDGELINNLSRFAADVISEYITM